MFGFDSEKEKSVADVMNVIGKFGEQMTFRKREIIFRCGEEAEVTHFLVDGRVRVCRVGTDDREKMIWLAEKGQVFGVEMLTPRRVRVKSAVAFTDCVTRALRLGDVRGIIEQDWMMWTGLMANSILSLEERYADHMLLKCPERLAKALVVLADGNGMLVMPQGDLADYVDGVRTRVNKLLGGLKVRKLIVAKGRALWVDVKAMKKMMLGEK
jgi:CRP-like cAMP-binding protein